MIKHKDKYYVVGIMSGTSTDGLDLALCNFEQKWGKWKFKIVAEETIPYNPVWKDRLHNAHNLNAFGFLKLHNKFGEFIGKEVNKFLENFDYPIDFISSHGHTVFHQPDDRFTFQIGSGASIAATTKITTIADFRVLDIALSGNGAPLVPIGDELLFSEYDFCLNLGGFANISFKENDTRIAYDICPVNIILNRLSKQIGNEYDNEGIIGRNGKISQDLLVKLNNLDYYSKILPKSLGREWLEENMIPVIESFKIPVNDKLRTLYEHISIQIYNSIEFRSGKKVLITGGGAFNLFLIELIKKYLKEQDVIIPDKTLANYKEALVFAFLGILRSRNEINCLSSVTGAQFDNIGGIIFQVN